MIRNKKNHGFFFSVFTAMALGIALSLLIIFISTPQVPANRIAKAQASEEDEEDPTFISRFSRVYIYSAKEETLERSDGVFPKTATPGKISAKSYSMVDLDRDITLLEKDPEKLMPIASVTKLVTAVVAKRLVAKSGGLNRQVEITRAMVNTYGTTGGLRVGEKYTVGELLYPLLMTSSNDSAEAIASFFGRANFIKEMNLWAGSIGAYRTYFADPSGLSPENVSTARDLTIITKWILKNKPEIFDITLTKTRNLRTHTWTNPTHFLNLTYFAGGKNGYTTEAGRTSVSLFRLGKDKRLYLVVLLASDSRDADTIEVIKQAI